VTSGLSDIWGTRRGPSLVRRLLLSATLHRAVQDLASWELREEKNIEIIIGETSWTCRRRVRGYTPRTGWVLEIIRRIGVAIGDRAW